MPYQDWRGYSAHGEYSVYQQAVKLWLARPGANGRLEGGARVAPTQFTVQTITPEDVGAPWDPSLEIPAELAKMLMGELWRLGIRPPGVRDDSDRVEAMRAHIEDLRAHIKQLHEIIRDGANTV